MVQVAIDFIKRMGTRLKLVSHYTKSLCLPRVQLYYNITCFMTHHLWWKKTHTKTAIRVVHCTVSFYKVYTIKNTPQTTSSFNPRVSVADKNVCFFSLSCYFPIVVLLNMDGTLWYNVIPTSFSKECTPFFLINNIKIEHNNCDK